MLFSALICEVKSDACVLTISISDLKLANGPYLLCKATKQIFSVCRLYSGTHHAFFYGILLQARRRDVSHALSVKTTRAGLEDPLASTPEFVQIPVPSRLYFRPSRRKPLVGVSINNT